MIRVVVADDHPAPRAGIVQALSRDPNIEVVGEASNGREVWALLASLDLDVLMLDLNMPDLNVPGEVYDMRARYRDVKILIVTADNSEESVASLKGAKVAGYLLKEEDMDRYIEAVHDVAEGRPFFSKRILSVAVNGGTPLPILTRREEEVLHLVAQGDTSAQIAHALQIQKRTADFHVANVLEKLNVESRAAATAKAISLGLISPWRDL